MTWLKPIRIPRATDQAEGGGWDSWRRVRQADVAGGEVVLGFRRVRLVFVRYIVLGIYLWGMVEGVEVPVRVTYRWGRQTVRKRFRAGPH